MRIARRGRWVRALCVAALALGAGALVPGAAWAVEEVSPVVSTGSASVLSPEAVTLSGSVDPMGFQTFYEFDFGIDTTYGSQIFGDAGMTAGAATVALTVEGLAPGTTYHYRVAAGNPYGESYGADETFTTPVYPSAQLEAPVAPPLIATPTVTFPPPTTASETTAPKATKPKRKKKAGGKQGKGRRRGKSATRAHKAGRGGRGRSGR